MAYATSLCTRAEKGLIDRCLELAVMQGLKAALKTVLADMLNDI